MADETTVEPSEDPAVPQPTTTTETYEDNTPWSTPGGYQAIYDANRDLIKNPNLIYPGQTFQMPGGGTYTVVQGDNLTFIAQGRGKGTYSRTLTREVAVTPEEPPAEEEVVVVAPKPVVKFPTAPDWRFRVSLAPRADYFYNAKEPGILAPLKSTNGVIFPYTPTVQVSYVAKYDTQTPTHSNFTINNYQHSSVEQVTVTGDFTAQDIVEANYLLATIHFFKSATKMFYGKDKSPARGVPPPLLYLSGFGQYQFDNHPVVLTNFTYTLPVDVDYINAYPNGTEVGVNGAELTAFNSGAKDQAGVIRAFIERLRSSLIDKGGKKPTNKSGKLPPTLSQSLTRVPTKISISLTFQPIVTRNAISNEFSLQDYASGKLLRGSQNKNTGGGIW